MFMLLRLMADMSVGFPVSTSLRWNGHGHVYVDELWVEPSYRGNGFAKALLKKADELKDELNATGIRLYVNVNNPIAQKLYEACGYVEDGRAIFMEK